MNDDEIRFLLQETLRQIDRMREEDTLIKRLIARNSAALNKDPELPVRILASHNELTKKQIKLASMLGSKLKK